MNKNDKAIKKVVKYQTQKAAEISDAIFKSFKKIYYEIKIKQNNKLSQDFAIKMLKHQMMRYTKKSNEDGVYSISIDEDMKQFLKSTGNRLKDEEINYMLYFYEDLHSLETDSISTGHFLDIYNALMTMSNEKPENILNEVLEHYFQNDKLDSWAMDIDKVTHFFETYSQHFTEEQKNYMVTECEYLERNFSRDTFNSIILAPRKYYPY
jgi:hypothetical protein